jgi:hypothetical protein
MVVSKVMLGEWKSGPISPVSFFTANLTACPLDFAPLLLLFLFEENN